MLSLVKRFYRFMIEPYKWRQSVLLQIVSACFNSFFLPCKEKRSECQLMFQLLKFQKSLNCSRKVPQVFSHLAIHVCSRTLSRLGNSLLFFFSFFRVKQVVPLIREKKTFIRKYSAQHSVFYKCSTKSKSVEAVSREVIFYFP